MGGPRPCVQRRSATLVLIGDPKQAIYAFRGGDVVTYLRAAGTATTRHTLATNWRSDAGLVDALQVLTRGAELGDPEITVLDVEAHHRQSRLVGAPVGAPLRLRQLRAADFPTGRDGTVRIDKLREHIATDLAADVARLLGSGATYDGEPIGAGHVALLLSSVKRVEPIRAALLAHGIPSVVGGGSSVMLSQAADEWLTLLEALEQQRTHPGAGGGADLVRRARPRSPSTPEVTRSPTGSAERVRSWLDLFRTRGVAAVHEAVTAAGLPGRVLSRPDGERLMTDLDHLGQLLHETARRAAARAARPARVVPRGAPRGLQPRPSAPAGSTPTRPPCRSSPSTAARDCSTPSSTCRTSSTATSPSRPSCSTTTRPAPDGSTSPGRPRPPGGRGPRTPARSCGSPTSR